MNKQRILSTILAMILLISLWNPAYAEVSGDPSMDTGIGAGPIDNADAQEYEHTDSPEKSVSEVESIPDQTEEMREEAPERFCGKEEHTHDAETCYEEFMVLDEETGQEHPYLFLTCKKEEHTHIEECEVDPYEEPQTEEEEAEDQAVYCGIEEHTHVYSCLKKANEELICEYADGEIIDDEGTVHHHTEDCYSFDWVFGCEKEAHAHADDCYIKPEEAQTDDVSPDAQGDSLTFDLTDENSIILEETPKEAMLANKALAPETRQLLKNGMQLRAAPVNQSPVTADGITLNRVTMRWLSRSSGESSPAKFDDLILRPGDNTFPNQQWQLDLSLSGSGKIPAGSIEILIPAYIWHDRNGREPGLLTLAVPEEPDMTDDFAWKRVDDTIVITNTRPISAASAYMLQGTFRMTYPDKYAHQYFQTVRASEMVSGSRSDALYAVVNVITPRKEELLSMTSNELFSEIHTNVVITSASKNPLGGKLHRTFPDALPESMRGQIPQEEREDYFYINWIVSGRSAGNQGFTMNLSDFASDIRAYRVEHGANGSQNIPIPELAGVKVLGMERSIGSGLQELEVASADGAGINEVMAQSDTQFGAEWAARVWTAIPKAYFEEEGVQYRIENTAKLSVTGKDTGETSEREATGAIAFRNTTKYKIRIVWDWSFQEYKNKWNLSSGMSQEKFDEFLTDLYSRRPETIPVWVTDSDRKTQFRWTFPDAEWDNDGTQGTDYEEYIKYQKTVRPVFDEPDFYPGNDYGNWSRKPMPGDDPAEVLDSEHWKNDHWLDQWYAEFEGEDYYTAWQVSQAFSSNSAYRLNEVMQEPKHYSDGSSFQLKHWFERVYYRYDETTHTFTFLNKYHQTEKIEYLLEIALAKYGADHSDSAPSSSEDRDLERLLENQKTSLIQYNLKSSARLLPYTTIDYDSDNGALTDPNKYAGKKVVYITEDQQVHFQGRKLEPKEYDIRQVQVDDALSYRWVPDRTAPMVEGVGSGYYELVRGYDSYLWALPDEEAEKPEDEQTWRRIARIKYDVERNWAGQLEPVYTIELLETDHRYAATLTYPDAEPSDPRSRCLTLPEGFCKVKTAVVTSAAKAECNLVVGVVLNPSLGNVEQAQSLIETSNGFAVGRVVNTGESRINSATGVDFDGGINAITGKEFGTEVLELEREGIAFIHGRYNRLKVELNKSFNALVEDRENRRFGFRNVVSLTQGSNLLSREDWALARQEDPADGGLPDSESGIFYDLLPRGMSADLSTVRIGNGAIKRAYIKPNYRGSGRQLLVVEAELGSSSHYDDLLEGYGTSHTLSFTSWYPFEAVTLYGFDFANNAAYEADEHVFGHGGGRPDEPGNVTWDAKELMTDLHPDRLNAGPGKDAVFYYAHDWFDDSRPDLAALIGLQKYAQAGSGSWSSGERHEINVEEGGRYSYQLAMSASVDQKMSGIVFYDNLETYADSEFRITDPGSNGGWSVGDIVSRDELESENETLQRIGLTPATAEEVHTTWQGVFESIDLSQLREMGVEPRVYYATQSLDLSQLEQQDIGIGNAAIWSATPPADLASVKAIAIDCTYAEGSTEMDPKYFELDSMKSLVAAVYMRAPNRTKAPNAFHATEYENHRKNGHAYNDVYALVTIFDSISEGRETKYIGHPNTMVGVIGKDLHVTKRWDDELDNDGIRPDSVTLHLYANGVDTGRTITVTKDDGWEGKFTQLSYFDENGDAILYTVKEEPIAGYRSKFSLVGDQGVLTNIHEPERIDVPFVKTWSAPAGASDNWKAQIPETVTVYLYKNGSNTGKKITVPTDADGQISGKFTNLLKYERGIPIVYTVKEIVPDNFRASYNKDGDTWTINNEYHPYGEIEVTKQVVGATTASADKPFTFRLDLRQEEGDLEINGSFDYVIEDGQGNEVKNGSIGAHGTFVLRGGQTIRISGIPTYTDDSSGTARATQYEIAENDTPGFVITDMTNASGRVGSAEPAQVLFVNAYESTGSVQLDVQKTLAGRSIRRNQFVFTLTDEEGRLIRSARNGAESTMLTAQNGVSTAQVQFGAIRYNQQDDGKTFTYSVAETAEHAPGYTYDSKTYTVRVTPHDNGDGTMHCDVVYLDDQGDEIGSVRFNNTYEASGTISLRAWKQLAGRQLTDGEFTFDLFRYDKNSTTPAGPIDTKNNVGGEVNFTALSFNETDIGKTYYYAIKEQAGADDSVVYDTKLYGYSIRVEDNGDGTLDFVQTPVDATGMFRDDMVPDPAWVPADGVLPVIKNNLAPGTIKVKKTVTSAGGATAPAQTFQFHLRLMGEEAAIAAWAEENGFAISDGVIDFSLAADAEASFEGIPAGTAYQVWEETPDGWLITEQTNTSGKVTEAATTEVRITNDHQPGSTQVQFMGTKTLDNRAAEEGAFSFVLSAAEGTDPEVMIIENGQQTSATLPITVDTKAGGFIQFPAIRFTVAGTYVYEIREVDPQNNDLDWDDHVETVTVEVTEDGSGNLSSNVTYDSDGIMFSNRTKPGNLEIRKVGNNVTSANKDDEFTFKVTLNNENGVPLSDEDSVYWYKKDAGGNIIMNTKSNAGNRARRALMAASGVNTLPALDSVQRSKIEPEDASSDGVKAPIDNDVKVDEAEAASVEKKKDQEESEEGILKKTWDKIKEFFGGIDVQADPLNEPARDDRLEGDTDLPKYAVGLMGIGVDKVLADDSDSGSSGPRITSAKQTNVGGLTFGPASRENPGGGYSSILRHKDDHDPTGRTSDEHMHRCIHKDSWETILYWNDIDPYVYEQCIDHACRKSIELNIPEELANDGSDTYSDPLHLVSFGDEMPGDGASGLKIEFKEQVVYEQRYTGGWGPSNTRAVLNGVSAGVTREDTWAFQQNITKETSLFSALPEALQQAIGDKEVCYYSDSRDKNDETRMVSYDKLWLFSGSEVFSDFTDQYEGATYPYYIAESGLPEAYSFQGWNQRRQDHEFYVYSGGMSPYIRNIPPQPSLYSMYILNTTYTSAYLYETYNDSNAPRAIAPGFTLKRSDRATSGHITYDPNGGTIAGQSGVYTLAAGEQIKDPETSAARQRFVGWSTNKRNYQAFDPETWDGQDITVYAIYEKYVPKYTYNVSIYGIRLDQVLDPVSGEAVTSGLTFGHAGSEPTHAHTPSGTTEGGQAHRCIEADSWEEIIYWNELDPYVYEDCQGEVNGRDPCVKTVEIDIPDKILADDYETQINQQSYADNKHAVELKNNAFNSRGLYDVIDWGSSSIRAVLNGADSLTNEQMFGKDVMPSESLFAGFPNALRASIAQREVKYNDVSETIQTSYDKLWLLSINEMLTEDEQYYDSYYYYDYRGRFANEGTRYPYFSIRDAFTHTGNGNILSRSMIQHVSGGIGIDRNKRIVWPYGNRDYILPAFSLASPSDEGSVGIRFDARGGYMARYIGRGEPGETYAAPSAEKPGFELESWNTAEDGSGVRYEIGDPIPFPDSGMVTLYAQWIVDTRVEYEVRHYQQSATDPTSYVLVEREFRKAHADEEVAVPRKSYPGFKMPAEQRVVPSADVVKEVEYYYGRAQYTVVFDGNGADSGKMQSLEGLAGRSMQLPENVFKRKGYFYSGWNTAPDGSGESYTDKQTFNRMGTDGEVITLYAQWLANANDPTPTAGVIYVTCKAEETIVIPDLPYGTTYTVEEVDLPAGWEYVFSYNTTGSIAANQTETVTVRNRYNASGSVQIRAHKKMEGDELEEGAFTFELRRGSSATGQLVSTKTNGAIDTNQHVMNEEGDVADNPYYDMGLIEFEPITFSMSDVTNTGDWTYIAYHLSERVDPDQTDIIFDTNPHQLYVRIRDAGGGNLEAELVGNNYQPLKEEPIFRNRMRTGDLQIEKTIENATERAKDKEHQFELTLLGENGQALAGSYPVKRYTPDTRPKMAMVPGGEVTKYSYTRNLTAEGTKDFDYGNSWSNSDIRGTDRESADRKAHVVTIEGAKTLHVKITYGGESSSYDWACMWAGAHPGYTAYDDYRSSVTGKLGGGSHTSASNTKEYDIDGDTVTFGYRSDTSIAGDGYGYYAVVTGQGMTAYDTGDVEDYIRETDLGRISSGGTIALKGGEYAEIKELPPGSTYRITETPAAGYTQTSASGDAGTIRGGAKQTASFTNRYEASGTIQFEAQKTFISGTIGGTYNDGSGGETTVEGETFTFELLDRNGNVLDTKEVVADPNDATHTTGTVTFDPIAYDTADDGNVYRYRIREVTGDNEKIVYDDHVEEIQVAVSDDGEGHMVATPAYDSDGLAFRNIMTSDLVVEKTVREGSGTDVFEFTAALTLDPDKHAGVYQYTEAGVKKTLLLNRDGSYRYGVVTDTAGGDVNNYVWAADAISSAVSEHEGKILIGFALAHRQRAIFNRLPAGIAYEVNESDPGENYDVEPPANKSGTLDEDEVVTYLNRGKSGTLTVRKLLAGQSAKLTDVFDFTVKLKLTDLTTQNGTYTYSVAGTNHTLIVADDGTYYLDDSANPISMTDGWIVLTFRLGHQQQARFTGLPINIDYEVIEDDPGEYTSTHTGDASGKLTGSKTVEFTNSKGDGPPPTGWGGGVRGGMLRFLAAWALAALAAGGVLVRNLKRRKKLRAS